MVNEHDARQRAEREAAAAEAFDLPKPVRRRERRRVRLTATLVVLVLAILAVASYKFAANAGHDQRAAAAGHPRTTDTAGPVAAASDLPSPAAASTAPASTTPASTAPASTAPASTTPAPASTPPPPPPPSQVLTVASVAAFGPGGLADGQNPQHAALAVSGNAATPWLSDWYVSPVFYDLPAGTGLLLDLGRTATVTSVTVSLNSHGADLQLRAGRKPVPALLPVVASASNVGGTVQLHPSAPLHVRYVLIWFTRLPPDGSGTYQASVYRIIVKGQP